MYSLSFMKASLHSSVQSRHFLFFIVVKNGLRLLVGSGVESAKGCRRDVVHPIRLCISFMVLGNLISIISLIWSGLASIPRLVTMYPLRICLTLLRRYFQIQLHVVLPQQVKRFLEMHYMVLPLFILNDHVVHVDFHRVFNLLLKDSVDESLVYYPLLHTNFQN